MRIPVSSFLPVLAVSALAALMLTAAPRAVHAQGVTFTGALTTTDPTFNRPEANGTSAPTTLSGRNVYFDVQPFYVNVTGGYDFRITAPTFDSFLVIYQNAFNAASPLNNAVGADDDRFQFAGDAGFTTFTLNSNVQYYFVTTSYANGQAGAYTNTIGTLTRPTGSQVTLGTTGPNAVPEPGVWVTAVSLAGTTAFGMVRGRRRTRKEAKQSA